MRINYKNRFIDDIGRVVMTADGLADLIIEGNNIDGILAEDCDETQKYNQFSDKKLKLYINSIADQSSIEYDSEATNNWKTPREYKEIDLESWLLARCDTSVAKTRVQKELNMYEERDLFPLLRHLIFLIDHFRKNNIIWGVGRGSSVASYVLYLIGIHKIDSIKYNLDINEFLR